MTHTDPREFRNALGQFATGVTVITTRDPEGNPVGVTASSFNSVSLDPPLVLWSLDKSSASLQAFSGHGYFAVHVLAAGQEDLSNNFARRGEDKFAGVDFQSGVGDVPVLPECAACFQCHLAYQYEGGDHIIFVGEVQDFINHGRPPLIFHSGSYARAKPHSGSEKTLGETVDYNSGGFTSDFLGYLLSQAHYQFHMPLLDDVAKQGLTESHYFLLSVLCIKNDMQLEDVRTFLKHTGQSPTMKECEELAELGLLSIGDDKQLLHVTEEGQSCYIKLLAADMARQEAALAEFTPEELAEFIGYLRRVVEKTDLGIPDLWK